MRICPRCRTVFSSPNQRDCPRDGAVLMDARELAESEGDPLVGAEVGGRFRITAKIGTGGMGTVYAAEQTGLGRSVALKILKKELVWDRDTVARFHREAKAMSLLTHPNTVRVFDFGETEDGLLYLAMELLEGELLTTKLEREGALDVREAVWVAQQILRSLGEAHTKGIIHRDLKPDNIYLAQIEGHETPMVKVLDFGIAKIIQGERAIDQLETQAGTVFGTPRYMSPEQAQGKPLDPRSDLYSVGILLYQLLTGRPPFVDDDAVVVMAKHIREKPDAPTVAAPDRPIPGSLEKTLLRAMEKDPGKRFASAARLDSKLEQCIPDVIAEIRAREQGSRTSILDAKVGRVPVLPLAIGSVVVAIALGFTSYLITSSTEAATPPPEPPAPLAAAPVPEPAPPPVPSVAPAEPAAPSVPALTAVEEADPFTIVADPEPETRRPAARNGNKVSRPPRGQRGNGAGQPSGNRPTEPYETW